MDHGTIRDPAGGANQVVVRDHNERLMLSMIHRHGALASADIARRTGLSPQTVSVILRKLEADGILQKGEPVRGKVGKPLTPVTLVPSGILSIGLKIGRRSCDLVLMDISGTVRVRHELNYAYPAPDAIMAFLREGLAAIHADLTPFEAGRICGLGIAAPFEMWNWLDVLNATPEAMAAWRGFDFITEIAKFSAYRVFVSNDATAACAAEHCYGHGREISDFAYFCIGHFVGGGVVLNDAIFAGRSGNAGAFGTLPIGDTTRAGHQLINSASLYLLEGALLDAGHDPMRIWHGDTGWEDVEPHLSEWIAQAAQSLAVAIVSVCSVIDFQAAVIDGGFPVPVRARLVQEIRAAITAIDTQGIVLPDIVEGSIGADARVIGAASLPITSQYLLSRTAFGS
jgi:predicted NBD/HSP70 family sugar kinase